MISAETAAAIEGGDLSPGCGRDTCPCRTRPREVCEEWAGVGEMRWCPRCGWAERLHPETIKERQEGDVSEDDSKCEINPETGEPLVRYEIRIHYPADGGSNVQSGWASGRELAAHLRALGDDAALFGLMARVAAARAASGGGS